MYNRGVVTYYFAGFGGYYTLQSLRHDLLFCRVWGFSRPSTTQIPGFRRLGLTLHGVEGFFMKG